jgi:hypothetical protein
MTKQKSITEAEVLCNDSKSQIQHRVEELWSRIDDVTDREYFLFTEVWQYLEDLKPNGDGIVGMLLRENKEKQKQRLMDILIENACLMCIEYSYVRGMDVDEKEIKVVADMVMALFYNSTRSKNAGGIQK